jgi:hypothetical protein
MRHVIHILLIFLAASTLAQDENTPTFTTIIHSSEETVAIDSVGRQWVYDRELGRFVPVEEYREGRGESFDRVDEDYTADDVILPPEIRCTDIREGDIIELFRSVEVDIDERVEGMIISGYDVTVRGLVIGDVISYRTVTVTSTGEVRGDVVARDIDRERGGRIIGKQHRVTIPGPVGIHIPRITPSAPSFPGLVMILLQVFLVVIVIAIASRPLDRILQKIEASLVKTFFIGLLCWFAIIPLFVLLVITIVGIPIAVLVFPLVLLAAVTLAFVSAAIFVGRRLSDYLGWQKKSVYIKAMVGVAGVGLLRILADVAEGIGMCSLSQFFNAIFGIIAVVTITFGLGAVVSARFGMRPKPAGPAPGRSVPTVKPPPPPRSDIMASDAPRTPPPPVPPPKPDSSGATDHDDDPSNK